MTKRKPMKRGFPAIHPGEFLRDVLNDNNMLATDLARLPGYSTQHPSRIMTSKAGFTAESAIKSARCTSTTPDAWVKLQNAYDMERSEKKLAKWKPAK